MDHFAAIRTVKSQQAIKTQGDCSESLIPDSDQEDILRSPLSNTGGTPTNKVKAKKLRFNTNNQICYYRRGSKKRLGDQSPLSPRTKSDSIQSILKHKEHSVFYYANK